jgi:hypothetical protein
MTKKEINKMKKVFCFHHYSPRTRFVSLSADCSDKHLEPIWFCEKCGKVIPRKPSDYARTDKPGSRKAWIKVSFKPERIGIEILSVVSLIAAVVLAYQSHSLILVTFTDCLIYALMLAFMVGFVILSYWLDKTNYKECLEEMVKLGYYTKGETK